MIKIGFVHNIEAKISVMWGLKNIMLPQARGSALGSAGYELMQALRQWIESAGAGSWKKSHPMTELLEKSGGRWRKRDGFVSPYFGLGKFARYLINRSKTELRTGFGAFKAKDVRKGRQLFFDERLQEIGQQAQTRRSFPVSDRMRGLLGATKLRRSGRAGQDYFPIKKTTTALEAAARPIARPVFAANSARIGTIFAEKFAKALQKRYEGA